MLLKGLTLLRWGALPPTPPFYILTWAFLLMQRQMTAASSILSIRPGAHKQLCVRDAEAWMSQCVSDNHLPICLTQPRHTVAGISDRLPQLLPCMVWHLNNGNLWEATSPPHTNATSWRHRVARARPALPVKHGRPQNTSSVKQVSKIASTVLMLYHPATDTLYLQYSVWL